MEFDDLLTLLEKNRFVIYGTGYIGKRFYRALEKHALDTNVELFAVTDLSDEQQIFNKKVVTVNDLSPECMICIAVHESIKDDIINELIRRNINNYIWIAPFINRLFLGEPERYDVLISNDSIIKKCDTYKLAVYYLAVENYYQKNDIGFDLYIKAHMLSCNKTTAEKRLNSFCSLIESWNTIGYDRLHKVCLDSDLNIIDGHHRIILAKYYDVSQMICDIYRSDSELRQWMTPEAAMSKDVFHHGKFSRYELELIDDTFGRLRSK